jgi:large subunit ribosomal protein L4
VLVVTAAGDVTTRKSLRNVPSVHLLESGQLNTYDVLVSDHVVFTEAALAEFVTRSGFEPPVPARQEAAEPADSEPEDSEPEDSEPEDSEEDTES